jgi:hypothetical protein
MRLLDYFRPSAPPPAPCVPPPLPSAADATRNIDRVGFHIERFERAIEQCQKGPERIAELQRELDYWRAIKTAQEAREA